jgi:PAS domain-containing protein
VGSLVAVARTGKCQGVPLETFSKVVESIYDCALDPTRWQGTICQIAELLQSQTCILGVHDHTMGRNELTIKLGYDDEYWWQLHEEKYSQISPFWTPLQLVPVGVVTTRAMLVDDAEFLESRFYLEWVKPQGLRDAITLKVLQTDQRSGLLVANRVASVPRYGDAEVHLLTLLSPHICRAITISDALNLKTIRSEALEATLNALVSGVYLVDGLGRVIYMNQAAERQIKSGKALRIENNRLAPTDRMARTTLTVAIDEAIHDEAATPTSGFSLGLPDREGAGLVAAILPLNRGERQNICGAFKAMAAIFVQDPLVAPPIPGEAFAKIYGLTASELRVLLTGTQHEGGGGGAGGE